jgi:hypothetical protein
MTIALDAMRTALANASTGPESTRSLMKSSITQILLESVTFAANAVAPTLNVLRARAPAQLAEEDQHRQHMRS